MKIHLTALLVLVSFIFANAQAKKVVFITDAEVSWLDKEIKSLESSIKVIKEGHQKEDQKLIASKKSAIMKSVMRLATNCNTMNNKIELELDPSKRRIAPDNPPNYEYNQKKKIKGFQELNISETEIATLYDNAFQMKEIKNILRATRFEFNPKKEASVENIDLVDRMLTFAQESNKIIQKSKTAE